MHYYKFNIAEWVKETHHLSLKEEAIYLRLINFYYDHEKPIPLKNHLVLRKLRLSDESDIVEMILEEFFIKSKKGWTHKYCDKLIGEYQKMADRNKKNAKLGGRPKNNDLAKPSGIPDANQVETESKSNGIPNYKLRTNNYKLETNNEKPASKKPTLDWSAAQMSESEIKEVLQIRKNAKAPVSQRVINKLAKEFDLSRQRGMSNDDILNIWSSKGWRAYENSWVKDDQIPRAPIGKKTQKTQADIEAARQNEIDEIWENMK